MSIPPSMSLRITSDYFYGQENQTIINQSDCQVLLLYSGSNRELEISDQIIFREQTDSKINSAANTAVVFSKKHFSDIESLFSSLTAEVALRNQDLSTFSFLCTAKEACFESTTNKILAVSALLGDINAPKNLDRSISLPAQFLALAKKMEEQCYSCIIVGIHLDRLYDRVTAQCFLEFKKRGFVWLQPDDPKTLRYIALKICDPTLSTLNNPLLGNLNKPIYLDETRTNRSRLSSLSFYLANYPPVTLKNSRNSLSLLSHRKSGSLPDVLRPQQRKDPFSHQFIKDNECQIFPDSTLTKDRPLVIMKKCGEVAVNYFEENKKSIAIIQQRKHGSFAAAMSMMIFYYQQSLDPGMLNNLLDEEKLETQPLDTYLKKFSFKMMVVDVIQDIFFENLKQVILGNGPAILPLKLDHQESHYIVAYAANTHFNEVKEVSILDPYYGMGISIRAESLFEKIKWTEDGKSQLKYCPVYQKQPNI